jgi:galactose mutarotase-like enzyme
MPGFFCLEPVSMVNDGFNLESRGWKGTGVRALGVGETMSVWWTVALESR